MKPILLLSFAGSSVAESGLDGWLRYAPLPNDIASKYKVPSNIISLNSTASSPVTTAGLELQKGIQGILGQKVEIALTGTSASSIVVGTAEQFAKTYGNTPSKDLEEDGFFLNSTGDGVQIVGQNDRGALYGAFEYLSMLGTGNLSKVAFATNPAQPIRWVNQWDNLDGSIERGYGGSSIVFQGGGIKTNLDRVAQYARLLASIRVNGIIINNVNANTALLSDRNIDGVGRVADAMRPYGIRVGISLNFDSPKSAGGLRTSDPLDTSVISYWAKTTDNIYKRIPDFAGYLVKANSEGQPGPLTYSRTLAQGANVFAKALKPHGGVVMFRAFVYDQLSYSNQKADRANAAVQFFKGLDGKFDENVVVQVKYGPIDFQVREPVSPLFSQLTQTNAAVELQVSQEYLGQQCHTVFLPPLWKTILDFDLRVGGQPSKVADVLSGKRFKRPLGGSAAVVNVGTHNTWLGSHMAMSNLYAYGKMAWAPSVDIESEILLPWTRLTFGFDPSLLEVVTRISMDSWRAYENYTGNLGIQTLTDITGNHYQPNPASHDGNGWGQWTRADRNGIGMDRTVKSGTGNAGQYPPDVAKMYETIETTPDDLLLWFHHVPYTQKLQSGETVIQHFYDAHYAGAATAQSFGPAWEKAAKGKLDDERYNSVMGHLVYMGGHAVVWRDAINRFYHDLSRIEDEQKRVLNKTWRIEAESMTLKNYRAAGVSLAIAASGGRAITATGEGTASAKLDFPDGVYDVAVGYFDVDGGKSKWEVSLNDNKIGEWVGDNEDRLFHARSGSLDGTTAARVMFRGVQVKKGDTIKITGKASGQEAAPLDYVAIVPPGGWD